MFAQEIGIRNGDELSRFVRALGQHRYVAGRLHLVHAFVFEAIADAPELDAARSWAATVLGDPAIDAGSRDPQLFRQATDPELAAALAAFWMPGPRREAACAALRRRLGTVSLPPEDREPFDEAREEDMFPVLVDAGWELVPLAKLEPERHKGAIGAFEDGLAFDVARFEEENAIPPIVTLHELPLLGSVELLDPFDDFGDTRAPFVLWASGHETYLDYVLRGVFRAAKLT